MCEGFFHDNCASQDPKGRVHGSKLYKSPRTCLFGSGAQVEDATDPNCLKSNQSKIRSCFVDILAAFNFNVVSSLYLAFCLQPVDTVRQIFPFFNWKPLVDICVRPAPSVVIFENSKLHWVVFIGFVKYVPSVYTEHACRARLTDCASLCTMYNVHCTCCTLYLTLSLCGCTYNVHYTCAVIPCKEALSYITFAIV